MRILITGGAGFIGSNLVSRLINDNEVIVIDNLSTGKEKNIEEFYSLSNFRFIERDITDNSIIDFIKSLNVDMIYNFACPASPKYYLENPIETWEANVLGVRNLLEVIKGTNIRLFQSSTSEVYGDALEYPQNEEYFGNVNPIGVRACYDEGKRAAETIIYDYIRKYNVDVRVARIFNTFGPKMSILDGRIISNFINQAIKNEDITIYGSGNQTRSFCYIDDTLDFIIMLMNSNINTYELSVNSIANIIKEKVNSNSKIVYLSPLSDDPQKRKPNISRAKELFDFEPKVSFEIGLSKTIDYFRRLYDKN